MYLFELEFCLAICPGVGLLDHMVILFLVFWGTSILLSIVAAPTYILTHSVGGFGFLHILSSVAVSNLIPSTPFHQITPQSEINNAL